MPVSHQTARLGRGRHDSPDDGVCVAELASQLAGERFTDRPASACPALTAFLRGYNDNLDDERRQQLYELAAVLVGSRRDGRTTCARARRLTDFARDHARRIGPLRLPVRLGQHSLLFGRCEAAGGHVARRVRRGGCSHEDVCALVRGMAEPQTDVLPMEHDRRAVLRPGAVRLPA